MRQPRQFLAVQLNRTQHHAVFVCKGLTLHSDCGKCLNMRCDSTAAYCACGCGLCSHSAAQRCGGTGGQLPARALRKARRKSPLFRASARRTALQPHSCCTLTCRAVGKKGLRKDCRRGQTDKTLQITREVSSLFNLPDAGVEFSHEGGVKVVPQHSVLAVQLRCARTPNAMCLQLDITSRHCPDADQKS